MNKSIVIVDLVLLFLTFLIILSKFIKIPFSQIFQPIFLGLILIHILQHWKFIKNSGRILFKKK